MGELANSVQDQVIRFRSMRLSDIGAVCRIEQESFTTPWSEAAFQNELTNNHYAHYLVMESGSELIGYGGMWLILDEAHVTNIAVRPAYRGRKLGEQLLRELQSTASFLGARKMTLEVRVSNHIAQRLYEKLGFYGAGLRRGYYSDNREDALIMWADLKRSDSESGRKEGEG